MNLYNIYLKFSNMNMNKFLVVTAMILICGGTLSAQNGRAEKVIKDDISSLNERKSFIDNRIKTKKKKLNKLESQDVDDFTKQQFYEDFGDIKNVKWERFNLYSEATFTSDKGVVTKAFYDNQPELIGTIVNKTFADLPLRAQKEVDKKYPGYTKDSVILYDDNEYNDEDIYLYDEPFSGPDNYFLELSKDGKTIVVGISELGELVFYKNLN